MPYESEYGVLAGPLVKLGVNVNQGHGFAFEATIDSGATKTLFPMWVAEKLEIRHLLKKDRNRSASIGSRFRTWSCPIGVTVRVIDDRDAANPVAWSAPFTFHPTFCKSDYAVAGREDFFGRYVITFAAVDVGESRIHTYKLETR